MHVDQYSKFFNMYPPPRMPIEVPSGAEALYKQGLVAAAKVS